MRQCRTLPFPPAPCAPPQGGDLLPARSLLFQARSSPFSSVLSLRSEGPVLRQPLGEGLGWLLARGALNLPALLAEKQS